MRLVLLGPPGAGKGTLAALLKGSLKVVHVSTGDILREEIKKKSDLGQQVKRFIDTGALVPDELITKIVEYKLMNDPKLKKGFILDGFPRTDAQAKDLDRILHSLKHPLDYVLYMEATLSIIIARLTGRRVCRKCGAVFHVKNRPPKQNNVCDLCQGELYQRADDNEETIKNRMDVYLKSTSPIIEYYEDQGILKKINSDHEAEDIQATLMKFFNEQRKLN